MLKPPYFNACLKEIAIYFNLDPRRVSSYSLRIVGASALAAAEFQIISSWIWIVGDPLPSYKYVRRTTEMFEITRYTVSRIDMLTLDKIRLMHAGRSNV